MKKIISSLFVLVLLAAGIIYAQQPVTITSGTVTVGTFPDNEPFNVAQKGGSAVIADPCERGTKVYFDIDQTSGEELINGTASQRIYICDIHLVTASAQNVALVSGTGTVCATSTTAVLGFGGATAATGWNLAANGGLTLGNGRGALGQTTADDDNVCMLMSGSGQLSGGGSYVSIVP